MKSLRKMTIQHLRLIGCITLLAIALQSNAVAQSLKVLVLDALDGKPQANVEVNYSCVGPPPNSKHQSVTTNISGLAEVPYFCTAQQKIEIYVISPNKKEQCGANEAPSFEVITSVGYVTKPDAAGSIWCPTKVSKKLKPVPGQVTMFIKKPTWYQSHVAG